MQIKLFTLIPGWQWEFHLTPLTNVWLVILVPVLLLGVVMAVVRLRKRPYLSLFLLLITGYCFQLSFGFLTEGGLDTIRRLYADSWHNVYAHAAAKDPAVLDVIRNYEKDYAEEYYFAMSKPPGVIVFYTIMEKIANLVQPEVTDHGRFLRLTWFITFVYPLISFLPVLLLYHLSKTLRPQDENAILPSILYISIPNILLMPLFLDQALYPLLFLLGGMLAVQLAVRPSPWLAVLLGVYLFTVNFISLSMLVLAAFVGAVLGVFLLADWSREKLVRMVLMGFAILAGLLGAFLFFRYLIGYDFITRAQAALDNHITHSFGVRTNEAIQIEEGQVFYNPGVRQRLEAMLMNNMEMLVWVGVPVFLLFLWGSVRSLGSLLRGQADKLDTFIAAFFVTYLAYNILGRTKGEVARLWMFMVPVMVLAAGHTLPRLFKRKALGVILVVVLQVITIYLIFGFQGFTA